MDITWSFALEGDNNVNGIGFRIYRQSPIGGSDTLIATSYQHSHWGTGNWTGPGTIILKVFDKPYNITGIHDADYGAVDVSNRGEGIYYYAQAYKEQGNNMYVNYGQDSEGVIVTVKEIRQ